MKTWRERRIAHRPLKTNQAGEALMGALQLNREDEASAQPQEAPRKLRSIGELARETGVTLRALRFYESKGLLKPVQAGHLRFYDPKDVDRLALILQGKRLGFTLCEIRRMLERPRDPTTPQSLPMSRKVCTEQIGLLERQRGEIENAILELRRIYTHMFVRSAEQAEPDAA
jgi:DNA-binding transcriptional MerR regulator